MRHIISVALLLLAIVLTAVPLQAQSGRARPAPSTPGTSTTRPPSGQTSTADEPDDTPESTGPAETIEGDVLRVDTSLVTVPVSVMDRYGKYIPNLRRQDFHVYDEGVEQKIAYFATVDKPFTVALVLDTSGSTEIKLEEIQNAAISFVHQLQPEDRVLVISFDDSIKVLTEATSDRDALMRAIRRTRTGGGTRLYDTVEMIIRKKLSALSGRKAVVLFTDGVDTTSRSATYSTTIREAQESDGAFYTVNYDTSHDAGNVVQGRPSTPGSTGIGIWIPGWPGANGGKGGLPGGIGNGPASGEYRRGAEYLHELADTSGGRYFRGDSMQGIESAFEEVAAELRRQYSLGYYPKKGGQAGQVRKIKVKVNKPDLVVKSRDSYIYSDKKTNDKDAGAKQLTGGN